MTFKANLTRGTFRAALVAALDMLMQWTSTRDDLALVRAGGIGQACLRRDCRSSLSLNLQWMEPLEENANALLAVGGGLILSASDVVALLFEPVYWSTVGSESNEEGQTVLAYGFRLSGARFGADIAFVRPLGEDAPDQFLMGNPFVAVTYRSDSR
jgi:hypothetical protein